LVLGVVIASCTAPSERPPVDAPDLRSLLPAPPSATEWAIVAGPLEFDAETLFEHLNGGAERYLGHGFRGLTWARYQLGDDALGSVEIEVFDMGTKEGAFGIYSAIRRSDAEFREWGSEGFRHGTVAAAWRNVVFVHGVADDNRASLTESLEAFVEQVVEAAPGDRSPPEVLAVLPRQGLVPRSECLVARALLGHAFLPGGLTASYRTDGATTHVFVCDLESPRSATAALEKLQTHHGLRGRLSQSSPAETWEGFEFDDPVLGQGEVRRSGRWIAGGYGDAVREDRRRILDQLEKRLAVSDATPGVLSGS
jgi:hypothetical protein